MLHYYLGTMSGKVLFAIAAMAAVCLYALLSFQQFFLMLTSLVTKDTNGKTLDNEVMAAGYRSKSKESKLIWPAGLMLDGNYVLREFVNTSDSQAMGIKNKPSKIEDMTDAGAEGRFYQLMEVNHLRCALTRRMGNKEDGGWDICISGPYKPLEGCLVYSFGIDNDFSFDDAMGRVYGCQVKSYDPSMKKGDHKRSDHVFFYNIGLGIANSINSHGWKLMSLHSILKMNGHLDKIVDYLKIDIEFSEWAALEVMLERQTLKNVKQFAMEIHTSELKKQTSTKFDFYRFYNALLGLEKQGFRRYHYHTNPSGLYKSKKSKKKRPCCYEFYYININFLKES